jgi:hypothetical protein
MPLADYLYLLWCTYCDIWGRLYLANAQLASVGQISYRARAGYCHRALASQPNRYFFPNMEMGSRPRGFYGYQTLSKVFTSSFHLNFEWWDWYFRKTYVKDFGYTNFEAILFTRPLRFVKLSVP